MKFGLEDSTIEKLQQIFETNPRVDKAYIFGSRAKGNYKPGSDIDLAVKGNLTFNDILKLQGQLDDLNLPYKVDLLAYNGIKEPALVEHIDRVGVELFNKWIETDYGPISFEFKPSKISKIAIKMSDAPFGSSIKSDDYVDDGAVVVQGNNIQGKKCDWSSLRFVTDEKYNSLKRSHCFIGDLIFPKVGTIGKVGILTKFDGKEKYILSTNTMMLRVDSQIANQDFVYYFFSSKKIRDFIEMTNPNSVQPVFNYTALKNFTIYLPPLPEQLAIATILNSLDDKIDLLHRQNKTLEQLAETLFRQWFVEEAEENWEEMSLYDAIIMVGGGTPKTEVPEYWDGKINWLSGGDIANNHKCFVMSSEKKITETGLENSSVNLLPPSATVISARGTVGKYCLLSESMAFSQSNYGVIPKYKGCFFFTYSLIAYYVDELIGAAYGSVFDTITTNTFKGTKIKLPSEERIQQFESEVRPYFNKMLLNQTQIRTLTQLRDALLPKLISGEVRVEI